MILIWTILRILFNSKQLLFLTNLTFDLDTHFALYILQEKQPSGTASLQKDACCWIFIIIPPDIADSQTCTHASLCLILINLSLSHESSFEINILIPLCAFSCLEGGTIITWRSKRSAPQSLGRDSTGLWAGFSDARWDNCQQSSLCWSSICCYMPYWTVVRVRLGFILFLF